MREQKHINTKVITKSKTTVDYINILRNILLKKREKKNPNKKVR